ncbi:ubiquitin carboxyl-terminal hydrolase 17-like isoform X2 [Abrus precatorius]|uniref:ubiquitinyl hydrolase 1 n=1 Tax=Abrus precatorius TaxID=3816 RepID=A0A8B8MHU3_ABRPR|nr:ubiquitin carboxyl-terminal hydrolase 17-like isoform X2 [Abrus precatorius]
MRVTIDLGFSSLLLVAVVFCVVPAIAFVLRRKWRSAAARAEEIKRLLVLAEEESARAESEASYQYDAVLVPKEKRCVVCYCPTTTRCARCKAVHYCSGKCQIVHWRQGHKDECHPPRPNTTCQTNDLVGDFGKTAAEPDYHGIRDEKSRIESTDCTTSSERPPLSNMSCPEISRAKDDNVRVESLQGENIMDPNSELSSNSFSGFSASASATESSDDSSFCESITSNENERSDGHIFGDPTHEITDSASNHNSIGLSTPLSPMFASLVDSVDDCPAMHKLNQVRPDFGKEENKYTSTGSSGLSIRKGATIEPSTVSSGFWNRTLDSTGIKDDSKSDLLPPYSDDSPPKSVVNSMPCAGSASSENGGVHSSDCADALSIRNLQMVGSTVSNHVVSKPGSTLKSAESRYLPRAFADAKLVSRTEEHSHYSTKFGNNGIQSGTATSSQVVSCSPNSKNGLRTSSVLQVADQFSGSNLSKHSPITVGSDITGKYSDKFMQGLFPYDLFVKLYNWNKVELQPFGLINCGNSCYANAVLQCLAFTPPLTAYLLQGLHSKSCANKKWCFTCEFESLILKSKDTKSPVSPTGIISQLQNIGSQLGNGREEDAHEFLRLAVETMQAVCLMEPGANTSDSIKEETNLMGLTFGGYLQSKIKCMKCGGKSERQERMMDLTVEIEGEIATLEEALQQFTSTETLDGENKYHCVSRCKSYEKAKKKMTVLEAPNVLTIALKRFQSGKFGKLNKPIQFPEILDLAPFMSGTSDLPIYRLYGVVVHLDIMNAAFSGHYVCYVKNFQSRWFKVDDSLVTAVELERVLTKGAYMLFYARCSPRAPRLIRNSIVSSDSKWKVHGKTVAKKSRHVSTLSGAGENMTSSTFPAGSHTLESIYSKFHHLKRILEEDSSSDNSSLISSNSDEGSCSTDSTCDSTSTDDFTDYIFGDSGRVLGGILRNSDTDISSALSSSHLNSRHLPSSDVDPNDSVFQLATGFQLQPPPPGPRVEINGLLYRSRPVDVKRNGGIVSHMHPDTIREHRKLDTSRSISFRETDSIQRAGSNHFNERRNSGVSCIKSRDRTD